MKPASLLRAAVLPLTELTVAFPLLMFWLIMCIGTSGSLIGLFVLLLALPPIFRYNMIVLESCAKGEVPGAFDAEFFSWHGNFWTLFPLPLMLAFILAGYYAGDAFGNAGIVGVLLLAGAYLPASLAVLAITHLPLQSLNPLAIGRLLGKTHESFWIASVYLLLLGWGVVQAEQLNDIAGNFIQLFALFSFSAVTGTLIEPFGLVDDVSIPEPVGEAEIDIAGKLEESRVAVLGHAYGFISRENRDGGFRHIIEWIEKETDVAGAWAWFFEHMMRWEQKQHALFFAQHYIRDMLRHGENIPTLKVIMRCRLVDEQFRPFSENLPTVIEAAESSGNIELAAVLRRA